MPAPDDRRTTRTPITLKIKFKSYSLDQFIERYSVDVSRGGIFIRTKEPLPVGTTLRFEFQLQDNSSLIGGEGTVVWNRAHDPARTGVAPGMGVRFDKLTADSQRVLDRILGEKHRRGEAQLESRFDAGVRASREARSQDLHEGMTPLPPPAPGLSTGMGHGGGAGGTFGDEPTRMMAADQVNLLAERMTHEDESFSEDQPTRRATFDEIQRVMSSAEALPTIGGQGTAQSSPPPISAPSRASVMGMVDPLLHAGTLPLNQTPALTQAPALAPSLTTRQVAPEEVAAMAAASLSARTPPEGETGRESGLASAGSPGGARQAPRLPGAPPSALQALAQQQPAALAGQPSSALQAMGVPSAALPPLVPEQGTVSTGMTAVLTPGGGVVTVGPPDFAQEPIGATLVDVPVPPIPAGPNGHDMMATLASPPPAESAELLAQYGGGPSSGISIGIDVDLGNDTSPARPLDPKEFAPPTPVAVAGGAGEEGQKAKGPGSTAEVRTPRQPVTGGPPQGRTLRMVLLLVLALLAAGAAVYALVITTRPPEEVRPVPPQRPEGEGAGPATPPAVKPGEGTGTPAAKPGEGTAGDKPGEGTAPDKGAGTAPDKGTAPAAGTAPEKGTAPAAGTAPDKAGDKPGADKPAAGTAPDKAGDKPGADKPAGKPEEAAAAKGPVAEIVSDPPGAKVELMGKAVGDTPAQLGELTPGKSYDIKLSLRGYQDAKLKVKLGANEKKTITTKLVPYERVVEVGSTPKGAEIWLDGKKVGRTPLVLKHLDLRRVHEIELRKTGYASRTEKIADTDTFDVKGGREVRVINLVLDFDKSAGKTEAPDKATERPRPHRVAPPEGDAAKPEGGKGDAAKPEAGESGKGESGKGEGGKGESAKPEGTKSEAAKPEETGEGKK